MKEYTYIKKITELEIDELMSSAMTGISYWCDNVTAGELKEAHQGKWHSELLSLGYTLNVHDTEEDKWHELTVEKLLNGLSLSSTYDKDQVDSVMGDVIIQYALFGKVIYG